MDPGRRHCSLAHAEFPPALIVSRRQRQHHALYYLNNVPVLKQSTDPHRLPPFSIQTDRKKVICVMEIFSGLVGDWNGRNRDFKWQRLPGAVWARSRARAGRASSIGSHSRAGTAGSARASAAARAKARPGKRRLASGGIFSSPTARRFPPAPARRPGWPPPSP